MKFGLIGQRLGHSYSPQIHKHFGSVPYTLFELEPEALQGFLTDKNFDGINVTIPYKKAVIPYCDRLTEVAQKLGAVNTVIRNCDGTLTGHNTDYFGFQSMVKHAKLNPQGKKVLVLGSGGASNTVCTVLRELGAHVTVISRQGENNYGNLEKHADCSVIVNATPVGMYPNNGVSPVSLELFPHLEGVLDLIYNPAKTKLILDAENRNLIAENGLWMLIAQAKESAEMFIGQIIPDEQIEVLYNRLQKQMKNIILIGMPGCGKSTVGSVLAQKLGRDFLDADAYLEQKIGMTIPRFFQSHDENEFRKEETSALSELCKLSGQVIATGGGCVTRPENKYILHQNSTVFWLKRPLCQLPTDGRPLSQITSAEAMYAVRKPLYQEFSDYQIENDGSPEAVADGIIQLLEATQ